jgi:hypothetical protein
VGYDRFRRAPLAPLEASIVRSHMFRSLALAALVAILVSACASQDSPYAGDACETIPASYCSREVGRCVGHTPDAGASLCLDKSLADCDSCPDSCVVPTRFTLPDDDLPLAGACAAAIAKAQAAR